MGGGTDRNLLSIVPISELEFFFFNNDVLQLFRRNQSIGFKNVIH